MDNRSTVCRPVTGKSQLVTIGAVVTHSSKLGEGTTGIRLMSTVDCWIDIDAANTTPAANTSMYLPAYSPEYFPCPHNGVVSTLQVAAAGSLYVTPCA